MDKSRDKGGLIVAGLAAIFLLATASAFAQSSDVKSIGQPGGNPIAGREKSQLCQGCHGEHGFSADGLIPNLAGQLAPYITKQILNYQAGTRTHPIMSGMAATVKDSDLADVSAYFASQSTMKGDGSGDNPLGKNLFLKGDPAKRRLGCANCHGMTGKGKGSNIQMFPVLGGQQKEYLRKQLMDFRDGARTNSPSGIMNTVTSSLTDAEIDALVEYISGQ